MKYFMFLFLAFAAPAQAFELNSEPVLCRKSFDAKLKRVVLSNRDLTTGNGEALSVSCLQVFTEASKSETLPIENQKSVSLFLELTVPADGLMESVEIILENSPRTRTQVEVKFLFGDGDGPGTLRATLSAKS